MNPITIRPAGIADLDACASSWEAMFRDVGRLPVDDFSPDWRRRFISYFGRRIEENQAYFALAIDGGEIVGTAGALVDDGYPASIHGLPFGYIFGVRTQPQYRGRGIARALTIEATKFLQTHNCLRIKLHASTAGRPIYERLGFAPSNEMILESLTLS